MKEFRYAVRQAVPLLFTYVFVGLAVGLMLREAGYSLLFVVLSSMLIYAGSMQIILLPLMTSFTPLPTLILTTFLVNARHIFYGIGFVEKFRKIGGWKYAFMALTVTDEAYSALCALRCPEDLDEEKVQFDLLAFCYCLWFTSCAVGALAGQLLPFDLAGVEFSATLFFATVVADQWRTFPSKLPILTGLGCAVLFYFVVGPANFLLPALSASFAVLLLLKDHIIMKMGGPQHV